MDHEGPGITIDIPTPVFEVALIGTIVLMAVGVVAALTVQLARTWRHGPRMKAIDDLSRKTGLAIPDELREPVAHAVAARTRGTLIASLIGLTAMMLVLRPWAPSPPELGMTGILVAIAVVTITQTVGAVVGGLIGRIAAPGTPRTARLTPLEYDDLIAPIERRLIITCAVAGVALPAALFVGQSAPWTDPDLVGFADARLLLVPGLLAAALAAALPRIARRLAAHRAIAGDAHALAWSDALASRMVRDLAYVAVSLGGLASLPAVMFLGSALPHDWTGVVDASMPIGMYVGVGVIIWISVVVLRREPERHVQRTLWPQSAREAQ